MPLYISKEKMLTLGNPAIANAVKGSTLAFAATNEKSEQTITRAKILALHREGKTCASQFVKRFTLLLDVCY